MAQSFAQNRLRTSIPEIAGAVAGNLSHRWQAYRVYRTTLNELRGLSSAELNDLGLNHTMLRGLALEASRKV